MVVLLTPKPGLSMEEPDLEQSSQHLPISFMSGFESRATFCGQTLARKVKKGKVRENQAPQCFTGFNACFSTQLTDGLL